MGFEPRPPPLTDTFARADAARPNLFVFPFYQCARGA